jgi:hypothetical protein
VNALGERQTLITCHDIYRRPGSSDRDRQGNYRLSFNAAIDPADEKLIRQAATCSMPTGNSRFMAQIEAVIKRKIGYESRGRPRRSADLKCR